MADQEHSVDVLMATYNGVRFLDQQILSVLRQSFAPFRLVVRDDGSTDGTAAVLMRYAAGREGVVKLLDDGLGHLGSRSSFGRLMEQSDASHIMLCDQDDVWLDDKIAATFQHMERLERLLGRECPILVHTDLIVADSDLRPVSQSFHAYEGLDPLHGAALNRLLLQNIVTGCTVMANRALIQRAMPIPPEAVMHDWWLALVAAAIGRLEYVPRTTVLYRQHGENRVGAQKLAAGYAIRRALSFFRRGGLADRLRGTQRQAQALLDRFGSELSAEQRSAVQAYAGLDAQGFVRRRATLIRYGFYKQGWLRNLGLFARV